MIGRPLTSGDDLKDGDDLKNDLRSSTWRWRRWRPRWIVMPIAPWSNMTLYPQVCHFRIVTPQVMTKIQIDSVMFIIFTSQ